MNISVPVNNGSCEERYHDQGFEKLSSVGGDGGWGKNDRDKGGREQDKGGRGWSGTRRGRTWVVGDKTREDVGGRGGGHGRYGGVYEMET
ncbi:hypothetical protein Syun_018847 [Stephania yunnanensis]|uniref:Uncharacterized protein n=1 Tax=Stephania yunnanensis TaxID=152371 RepID=A0AAP0IU42_9MAGN